MITVERLRTLFDYSEETGNFIRKITVANKKAGSIAGYLSEQGYIRMEIDGHAYFAHQLAYMWMVGVFPKNLIDHINGNRKDNRFLNLRLCNNFENTRNHKIRKDNKSGFIGVYKHSVNNSWCAHIKAGEKLIYLGSFKSPEEAAKIRDEAARKLHGEFAALNFA